MSENKLPVCTLGTRGLGEMGRLVPEQSHDRPRPGGGYSPHLTPQSLSLYPPEYQLVTEKPQGAPTHIRGVIFI